MMSSLAVSPVSNTITPRLVCGTRLVTEARPAFYWYKWIRPPASACMRGSASIKSFTVDVICATLVLWSCSKCCLSRLSDMLIFLLTFSFCSGRKSENFLTLLFRHVLLHYKFQTEIEFLNWLSFMYTYVFGFLPVVVVVMSACVFGFHLCLL